MKVFVLVVILLLTTFIFTTMVEAKILPQAKIGQTANVGTGSSISIYPKLRVDRRALIVNFSNLQNANQVSYLLVYKHASSGDGTDGQEEAAQGGLNLNAGSSQSSELLFGTCSKNVCRYHTGITNAKLEVSYTSKSGKKYLKRYRIRV